MPFCGYVDHIIEATFLTMEVKGIPAPVQSHENPYELVDVNTNVRRNDDQSREAIASWNKGSKQSTWSTPLVVIAVLQCLMVLLLIVILCLSLVQLFARDATSTSTTTTGAITGNNGSPNFTQWANDMTSMNGLMVHHKIPFNYFRTIPSLLNLINKSYKLQEILHKSSLTLSILSLIYKTPVPLLLE